MNDSIYITSAATYDIENTLGNYYARSSVLSDGACTTDNNSEIKAYIDEKLKKQAEKTYDIISKLIQWNVDKEEFVNLLLSDEE